MANKIKYSNEDNRTDIPRYRRKTIPKPDDRQGKTLSEWYYASLKALPLWETILITHHQTHAQAVASVNYAGGNLLRRFKTVEQSPGVIAVWRYE